MKTLREITRTKQADGASKQSALGDPARRIAERSNAALMLLLEAHENAHEVARGQWDFAVEIADLRSAGLSNSGLRWLTCKGYVEHAREITVAGEEGRSFRRDRSLIFHRKTCFVLTQAGVAFARQFVTSELCACGSAIFGAPSAANRLPDTSIVPTWDQDRQQLRLGDQLIKRYKVPAANQEKILAAFQEEYWPPRIDDPLSPHPDQDSKRRLHDTINSLNRKQINPLIRFLGDGTGTGIRWELTANLRRAALVEQIQKMPSSNHANGKLNGHHPAANGSYSVAH